MNLWIAFFRGINVGGHHKLLMKELKALLDGMGCKNVSTYIQSGNVVFSHKEFQARALEASIARAVNSTFGFEPRVMLLTSDQLIAARSNNPFPAAECEPKTLHFFFLSENVERADWEALDSLKSNTECFELIKDVFYLYAPDGIGRSKLAAKVEKHLGVPVTARNWRTVEKVLQLASAAN